MLQGAEGGRQETGKRRGGGEGTEERGAGRAVQAGDGRSSMPTVSQKHGSEEAEEDEKSTTMTRLATGDGGGATFLSEPSS